MKGIDGISKASQKELDDYRRSLEKISKFSDVPTSSSNLFALQLHGIIEFKVTQLKSDKIDNITIMRDSDDSVETGFETRNVFERKYVDDDKFVKIYQGQLKAVFALGSAAIKVFGYFIHEMQGIHGKDTDLIYFNIQDCMEFCEYNVHNQVYKGMLELIKKEFIMASTRQNFYFINPQYVFNGNRIRIFQEFIRKDGLKKAGEQHREREMLDQGYPITDTEDW